MSGEVIDSPHNPKIKWIRSLQSQNKARQEAGAIVVEGIRLAEEALATRLSAQLVLYTPDLSERGLAVVEEFRRRGAPVEAVTDRAMSAASDTQTPQGVLAVLAWQPVPVPSHPDFVLIPDKVRDPGNLGTILRSAAAAGVDGVFLPPGAVDPLSPKVVRAGMGAHFRLPVLSLSWEEIRSIAEGANLQVYLAATGEGVPYNQADFRRPLALIIGGEAHGAGQKARGLAEHKVHIPMPGKMESLNAGVASAVLLFEVVRQRSEVTEDVGAVR